MGVALVFASHGDMPCSKQLFGAESMPHYRYSTKYYSTSKYYRMHPVTYGR